MGSLNSSSLLPPSCDHATPAGRPPPTSNISGGVQFEANLTSHRSGDIDQRIQGKARYPASKEIIHAWLGHSTLAALAGRAASLVRNARLKPRSTIQSAIGVCNPVVRQRSQGFMGGSYNTREFFHGRSAQALRSIKWFFLAAGFVLPAGLQASLESTRGVLLLSVVVQFAGLIAERWFFFAQAYHPQNLYYQAVS